MLLPLPVASRIASFNVESTSQLARLRPVCRSFHRSLLAHVGNGAPQHVRCPPYNTDLVVTFLDSLCFELGGATPGDLISLGDIAGNSIFQGDYRLDTIRLLSSSFDMPASVDLNTTASIDEILSVCVQLEVVASMEDMNRVASTIAGTSVVNPLRFTPEKRKAPEQIGDYVFIRGLIKLSIDSDKAGSALRSQNGREWLELATSVVDGADENADILPCHQGCVYAAPVLFRDDSIVRAAVLLDIFISDDTIWTLADDGYILESLMVSTPLQRAQRNAVLVEGITIVDDFYAGRHELCDKIDALAKLQEQNNAVDFHPNSHRVVRNIVHPAKYCYVDKVTQVQKPTLESIASSTDESKDFWGRRYENSIYQWLPTYFSIGEDGSCMIEDYINNLGPRDSGVNAALYEELEKLFECCLPFVESTYSYVQAIRPHLRDEDEEMDYDDREPSPPEVKFFSLRGQKLQVITKIVDYNLVRGQTHGGVWHVEGMSHEEIVLTVLYIADRDDDFSGADIEFKRAFLRKEAEYLFSTVPQCRHPVANEVIETGLVPLGTVSTPKGRLIVFPNSHVHRVSEMFFAAQDDSDRKSSTRRIVVFFLVNPNKRIMSTREVPPQQEALGGTMSEDDALEYRRQLMHERRHTKQDWNVREIELCEH